MSRARKSGETFEQYRENRKRENEWLNARCSGGWLVWNSSVNGTYVRAKHGPLGVRHATP